MYQVHVAAFAIIAILLMKGTITVGVATATIAYIQDFMFPIRTIVDCSSYLKSVEGVKNQILGEIKEKVYRGVDAYKFQKNITLDHVHFKYDTFELRDFSCVFEKGKKYALVGPSGTGKSTILNLLTGNLVPQSGEIRVDGQPLSYDKCLNSMVYANQQAVIYMESFMENITMFGSFDVDKLAEKMIPVERWNYFKGVSDCTNLSGGEKQLVSLARVLSEGKEILVLDEPFSALDKELEFDVCEKLLGLKDKTVIMVTHNEDENFLRLFDEVITFGEK